MLKLYVVVHGVVSSPSLGRCMAAVKDKILYHTPIFQMDSSEREISWPLTLLLSLLQDLGSLLLSSYESCLLYDAVQIFARAVELLSNATDIEGPRVSCSDPEEPYQLGEELMGSIQQVSKISDCQIVALL